MKSTTLNKKLSQLMLRTNFICNLLYSTTYPYIFYKTMQQITDTYISIDKIINCIAIVIFGLLWNNFGDKLFSHYKLFCVLESIGDILYTVVSIVTNNLKIYWLSSSIIMALLTQNIIFGGTRLRAKVHPTDKEREKYDNNRDMTNAVAVLVGNIFAMATNVDLNILLVVACVGNIIDNISYCYIWHLVKKQDCLYN